MRDSALMIILKLSPLCSLVAWLKGECVCLELSRGGYYLVHVTTPQARKISAPLLLHTRRAIQGGEFFKNN